MAKRSDVRYAEVDRKVDGVGVHVVLDLDGGTKSDVATGVRQLDRGLRAFARFACVDLGIQVDLEGSPSADMIAAAVGDALGGAFTSALGGRSDSEAIASGITPKGGATVSVAVDLEGDGRLVYVCPFAREMIDDLPCEALETFWGRFARQGKCTLHVRREVGGADADACEAMFKGVGRAVGKAARPSERRG